MDITTGSYTDGRPAKSIYSFFPDVESGYKILEKPHLPINLAIHIQNIRSMNVKLTDRDGNILDLRGERLSISFHIREIK